jgi:hypothetical protein
MLVTIFVYPVCFRTWIGSQDISQYSVGLHGLDSQGSIPSRGKKFLTTSQHPDWLWICPASYPMGTRGSFCGSKLAIAWSWPLTSIQWQGQELYVRVQLLALEHCWSISSGSCLTTLLTARLSLWVSTTCLPAWRTGWDHSVSTIIRSYGRCQNVAVSTGGRLLWHRYTKLIPQYGKCLNSGGDCIEK